jgi:hypothetical protein
VVGPPLDKGILDAKRECLARHPTLALRTEMPTGYAQRQAVWQ